ncbi:MAG: hypothetical protein WC867_05655, partial [Candidatus Pacearchaeota archaeon]
MNLDDLTQSYQDYNAILRLKNKSKKDKLKARKKLVLAELASAYTIETFDALLAAKASKISFNKKKEFNKKIIEDNNYPELNYNFINNNEDYEIISSDYSIKSKKETLENLTNSNEQLDSYLAALNLTENSSALKKYVEQIKDLEKKEDLDGLEAILNAGHNVAINNSSIEFLNVFQSLPSIDDNILFSKLTSRFIPDQTTIGMGFNPLTLRLSQISNQVLKEIEKTPKGNKDLPIKNSLINDDFDLRSNRNSRNIKIIKSNDYINDLYDLKSSDYSTLLIDENLYNTNRLDKRISFFTDISEIYKNLGSEIGRSWLEKSIEIFDKDNKKGSVFIERSRPILETYVKQLSWDVEELAKDFDGFGTNIFDLKELMDKYSGLNTKRKRILARSIIDTLDTTTLEEFQM